MWSESTRFKDKNRFIAIEKTWPDAFDSCFLNLRKFKDYLELGGNPVNYKAGFFRSEKKGVYRIGQTKTRHSQEIRLYIYPDTFDTIIYLLTIGTKKDQPADIALCHEIAKAIVRQHTEEFNTSESRESPADVQPYETTHPKGNEDGKAEEL
jgi:hypothetical protein